MAKDLGGVWRTIGGRRVFIKDGENLSTAMKKSGKFKIKSKKDENDLSYQGSNDGSGKAKSTGKYADTLIEEVRNWEKEGKNSKVIERNKEGIETLKQIEGNPDAKVKIYRATPGDNINDGDWVFIDKQHAEEWTKTPFGTPKPGFKVVEMETEARNLEWAGKNLEFAYREPKTGKTEESKDFSTSKYTKTLYHGTDAEFKEFSLEHFGKHDEGDFGKGIYFSEDEKTASKYGKNIKEANVNIQNPLVINKKEDYEKLWHNIAKDIDKSKLSKEDVEIYKDKYIPQSDKDFMIYDKLTAQQKMDAIKKMGYDGIVDNTYHQVVVFDKNQIKINDKGLKSAYEKYLKEHPNSKITIGYFEKNIYK